MKTTSLLLSVGQLGRLLGVCSGTVRRWCREGKLHESSRTAGNHRRFSFESYSHLLPMADADTDSRKVVGYARVSSHDQRSDLELQAQRLKDCGCNTVISDLGSGLNCRKPGLRKLLWLIWSGQVSRLVLTHDDRLLRFGTEIVYLMCKWMHTEIVILDDPQDVTFETELVRDVITLMTVFSARLYGRRSWKNRISKER